MKVYLGIDYGRARIGLAVSEMGRIARPLTVIKNKGDRRNLAAVREIVTRYCGGMTDRLPVVVCGLPCLADGKESDFAREVRRFGDFLGRELGVEVLYQNEYLTSVEAEELIRERGLKDEVDAVAACLILQGYLTGIKHPGSLRLPPL